MTSAALFREGYDLDELLAELDKEHPEGVRVLDVRYDREGGVMGFFARRRVAVSYTPAPGAAPAVAAEPVVEPIIGLTVEPDEERTEFARMLREMAAEKAALRHREDEPDVDFFEIWAEKVAADRAEAGTPAPVNGAAATGSAVESVIAEALAAAAPPAAVPPAAVPPAAVPPAAVPPAAVPPAAAARAAEPAVATAAQAPPAAPVPSVAPAAPVAEIPIATSPVPAAATPTATEPLQLRRRLLDLGIPVNWLPADADDPVACVRAAVGHLPAAQPPRSSTFLLVVAGPGDLALETAREVQQRLGLRRPVRTVGFAESATELRDERQAALLAAEVRYGEDGPAVVAVALDHTAAAGWGDDAARRIIDRLEPDAVWGAADARWRPSDVRGLLSHLPRTDALAVVHADRTVGPAALWELGLPVALLDGRPATSAAWTALLLDRLDTLA